MKQFLTILISVSAFAGVHAHPLFTGEESYVISPGTPEGTFEFEGNILRASGTPNAYIRSAKRHANYHLCFDYRWTGTPGNSGVLFHFSEDGVANPKWPWPVCAEAQLKAENAGDFVLLGKNGPKATLKGEVYQISDQDEKPWKVVPKNLPSNEKPAGEWNHYDVIVKGDRVKILVNHEVQTEASGLSLQEGYIGFQSEGAPIEFRNVHLEDAP